MRNTLPKRYKSIGRFPGHSNPPPPPTRAEYRKSKHFRKMRIKYDNDLFMEMIELLVNLDN